MNDLNDRQFVEALRCSVGPENCDVVLSALALEPSVSIRLNPFKTPSPLQPGDEPSAVDLPSETLEWNGCARILKERVNFTLDPLFAAGAYYVQDSSAMFVGTVFRSLLPEVMHDGELRVLDLCAAPGGKTTDLAASLRSAVSGRFTLVANEVMKQRSSVLADNVAVWGDPCVRVTSMDPSSFGAAEGLFDVIVADVPCSGEGMFRKDARSLREWTPDIVRFCASRQRRIISDVWPSLKPGGILIYSTCTFSVEENDANVEWIGDGLDADILDLPRGFHGPVPSEHGMLMLPGLVPGEGQYVAALRKRSGKQLSPKSASEALGRLRVLQTGESDRVLRIGLQDMGVPVVEVDRATALRFLHRDSFPLPGAPAGLIALSYRGLPLGMVKNLGVRCNNLYPKSRRILMDLPK